MATRKAQAAESRETILNSTVAVIQERGFPATRIADVAAHAGVSTGLVLYHFESRDKLLAAALTHTEMGFIALAREAADRGGDPRERLKLLIDIAFEESDDYDLATSWVLWLDMWQQALHNKRIRTARQELDRLWRGVISDTVREGQKLGIFADADPDRFAHMLTSLQDGLAISIVLGDRELSNAEARAICLQLCNHELGAGLY